MIATIAAAAVGTVAFCVLFSIPKKYYPGCALTGIVTWCVYLLVQQGFGRGVGESTYFGILISALLSRYLAVRLQCPTTVFIVACIIPLVPGAGIYWTAYYLVTRDFATARASGFEAITIVICIVLGIVTAYGLPGKIFKIGKRQEQR